MSKTNRESKKTKYKSLFFIKYAQAAKRDGNKAGWEKILDTQRKIAFRTKSRATMMIEIDAKRGVCQQINL
jgi:hypothetical protein